MKKYGKKIFTAIFALLLTCTLAIPNNVVVKADTGIKVYLDGVQLSYVEAQPQIIGDRAMVPLTETATHFGMISTWDSNTSTMTFTGNNTVLTHITYQNVIYNNGVAKTFDFASTIVNGRTLMPIRMLAEALGCKVDWEPATSSIIIKKAASSSVITPTTPITTPTVAAIAEVYGAKLDSTSIDIEDSVKVTVSTNKAATKVKVTDENDSILGESTNYTTDTEGAYFTLNVTPLQTGTVKLKVYAGTATGYTSSYKTVSLTVKDNTPDISIDKITLDESTVAEGDDVTVTIKTSSDVAKIVIMDPDKDKVTTKTSPTSKTSSVYTWKITFTADYDDSGTLTYYVYAYDDDDNSINDTFKLKMSGSSSSSSSYPEINSISQGDVTSSDKVTVTVKTNKAVEKVTVEDYDGDVLKSTTSTSSTSGSVYTWELTFSVSNYDDGDNFYVYAYGDDEDDYAEDSFSLDW